MSEKTKILMELRPALDGFYGIPHETRLLFSALSGMPDLEASGLLQMAKRMTRGGIADNDLSIAETVHCCSRTVVSLKGAAAVDWKQGVGEFLEEQMERVKLRLCAYFGIGGIKLRRFETKHFRDFVWEELFARSVPSSDRERVLGCDHRVCAVPWQWMHLVGIERRTLLGRPSYPNIDMSEFDVFIAQTPYPGNIGRNTRLVVHYHDAIPVLMPHTISRRAFHEASHYHALAANVRDGAHFVCVSDATRRDLLSLFPDAEDRAVTIHNMLPAHYFPSDPEPDRVAGIVRRYQLANFIPKGIKKPNRAYKLSRQFSGEGEKSAFYAQAFNAKTRYVLMVSTMEPRKNHRRLLEAWSIVRDRSDRDLRLIFVGHIGWDYEDLLQGCEALIEQGGLFLLQNVPADALRVLYRQAHVTVCPSSGEGFDLSGIEAMRCGGVVAASDIAVHREVYGQAAYYFDAYDTGSLVEALHAIIYGENALERQDDLRKKGSVQSAKYLPEKILPLWRDFLRAAQNITNRT